MALEEYKRKRNFKQTPEPEPIVEKKSANRFVVQKHHASRLHFDFRLEMDGVLKSWAVPKGPPLDPKDKRLAMQVEDHPVSYFDFEGIIPEGNYGAGTVMVWDMGTWEPLGDAEQMLEKGDLKFRLNGKKLKGEFVLARMRSRRPGSKGTEWLLIKKRDAYVSEDFEATDEEHDWSVLTKRSLEEIGKDKDSAEWESSRASAGSAKNAWLAKSVAIAEEKRGGVKNRRSATPRKQIGRRKEESSSAQFAATKLKGAVKEPMPRVIHPMLATLVDAAFDDKDWLFEVKFDGYRALGFIDDERMKLMSRNQNDLTKDFPELNDLPAHIRAKQAILDGEVCALDEEGRPSFSLMQQRTGVEPGHIRRRSNTAKGIPLVYYIFDLLYCDGYSLFRVDLEKRKELLSELLTANDLFRYSEHFVEKGMSLYEVAKEKGLEGIIAKRRAGCYLQKRSREWLKIKLTQRQECVIGGYTDPRGSREHFGSLVLGLYDDEGRLIPVGRVGSGFTYKSHGEMWQRLKKLETTQNPFAVRPESSCGIHYVKPELVAEIKFTEWTHEGKKGGLKMRAPVFQGLRFDKKPEECRFERKRSALVEKERAA